MFSGADLHNYLQHKYAMLGYTQTNTHTRNIPSGKGDRQRRRRVV